MKLWTAGTLAIALALTPGSIRAAETAIAPDQSGFAFLAVSACGNVDFSGAAAAGKFRPATIDVNGYLCTKALGGGGGTSGGSVYGPTAEGAAPAQPPIYNGYKDGAGQTRGVSPTTPLPALPFDVRGNGALDASSTASKIDIPLNATATVGLTFGTFPAGSVVTFYTSNDGGSTYSVKSSTNCSAPQNASSTYSTSNGQPRIDVAGATNLRVIVSSTGTGSIPYTYNLSAAPLTCPNIQANNVLQWAGALVGAPSAYGTAPTGAVPGFNGFITNTVAVTWASAQPINNVQINGTPISTGNGTVDGGTQRVVDPNNRSYQGAAALTVNGTVAASPYRALAATCTAAGELSLLMADGSTLYWTVAPGYNFQPFAATKIVTSGATCSRYQGFN